MATKIYLPFFNMPKKKKKKSHWKPNLGHWTMTKDEIGQSKNCGH
jgi:hypothetical protein